MAVTNGKQLTKDFQYKRQLILNFANENDVKASCEGDYIILIAEHKTIKLMPKKMKYTINNITKDYYNAIAMLNIELGTTKQH